MNAPHRHGEGFAPHVAYTPMDTKWAQQMQAAITDGAVSQAVVDKLSYAVAATSLSEEADELMQVQLQDLAAGRLGDMLAAKQRVRITGLVGRPELNGTYAKVLCYDEARGRYAVMTEVGREQLALKRPNLTLAIESEATAAMADAIAAGSAQQAAIAGGVRPSAEVQALLDRGHAALEACDVEGARLVGQQMVTLDATDALGHLMLADASNLGGDLGRAFPAYIEALAHAHKGSLAWAKVVVRS